MLPSPCGWFVIMFLISEFHVGIQLNFWTLDIASSKATVKTCFDTFKETDYWLNSLWFKNIFNFIRCDNVIVVTFFFFKDSFFFEIYPITWCGNCFKIFQQRKQRREKGIVAKIANYWCVESTFLYRGSIVLFTLFFCECHFSLIFFESLSESLC